MSAVVWLPGARASSRPPRAVTSRAALRTLRGSLPLAGLLVLLALLAAALPARGHAFLVQTTPRGGERLTVAPDGVRLRFSEPVVSADLSLTPADGGPTLHMDERRSSGGLVVETGLPALGEGIYVVAYEVSAEDAHISAGEFAFAVGDVDESMIEARGARQAVESLSWPQVLARWSLVAGLLLALGGLASERFVFRPPAHETASLRLPVGALLAMAALGGIVSLALLLLGPPAGLAEAGDLLGRPLSPPVLALAAQLMLVTVGARLLLVSSRARTWALLPLAVAVAITASTGHPASQGIVTVAANVVHLAAVALWTGALLNVTLVLWRRRHATDRAWVRQGLGRYATAALAAVAVVIVSGLLLALAQFERPGELLDTTYGRLLIAKLSLVALALALALLGRLRGLRRDRPLRARLLSRATRLEALALIGALGLAGAVASVTPPSAVRGTSFLLGPPPLEGPVLRSAELAGSMAVHLAAAPGRLELRALGLSGEGVGGAELRLRGEGPSGVGLDLQPRDCGPGCWTTALTWARGTTTLRADLSAPDWPRGSVELQVDWPPGAEAPDRLERVIAAMRAEPRVVMTERVTSGPGMVGEAHTFRDSGEAFTARELYVAGGATDVHTVPPRQGDTALTLYLPGSSIWFRLEVDQRDRIVAETIVSPGHLIERVYFYPR